MSKWQGFHHIEQMMWAKHTLQGATPLAKGLLANIETLNDMARRWHWRPSS